MASGGSRPQSASRQRDKEPACIGMFELYADEGRAKSSTRGHVSGYHFHGLRPRLELQSRTRSGGKSSNLSHVLSDGVKSWITWRGGRTSPRA